jgi:hypothetical protein
MATTRLIPIHLSGRTLGKALAKSLNYAMNGAKTNNGEWVTAYECDPLTAAREFQFSKGEYARITGRNQGKNDVIAYHLRISFKYGEADPETASKVAYDLVMKLTKGNNAFVCCYHGDKQHPHVHVIFNSTTLDCRRKYRNFYNSSFHIRKIADHFCLENGLSIIEKPKLASESKDYGKWLGDKKLPTAREQLQDIMDEVIPTCKNYDDFIAAMQEKNVQIKFGKQLAFKLPTAKRFARHDTLGDDYSMTAILERMAGKRTVEPRKKYVPPAVPTSNKISSTVKPNLLIDIQAKIQEGKGAGYEHWARIFNIKEMSRTLIYLKEIDIDSYEELAKKSAETSADFNQSSHQLRVIEQKQKEISELQKSIGTYGKTRDTYRAWIASGRDPNLYETYRADITLHEAAKRTFDNLGYGKNKPLPKIFSLKQEWATLEAQKKKLYKSYYTMRDQIRELAIAKGNCERILGIGKSGAETTAEHNNPRAKNCNHTHEL